MALDFTSFEGVLQTKLDTITDEKDMLLLGKAIEATVGNVAVSELQTEGSVQKAAVAATGSTEVSAVQAQGTSERNQINAMSSGFATSSSLAAVATSGNFNDLSNQPTFKTVAGNPILGSGDINIQTKVHQAQTSSTAAISVNALFLTLNFTLPATTNLVVWGHVSTRNSNHTYYDVYLDGGNLAQLAVKDQQGGTWRNSNDFVVHIANCAAGSHSITFKNTGGSTATLADGGRPTCTLIAMEVS